MKNRSILCLGASLLGLFGAAPLAAQTAIQGVGVADRARPDYDPIGVPVGGYRLYPAVTLSGLATDNYLATDLNKRGDVYLDVRPEFVLRGQDDRSSFLASGFVDQSVHANLSGDDATQFGAAASAAFDPTHSLQFTADVGANRYVEARSSLGAFQGSRDPVHFDAYHAGVGTTKSFNDLTLKLTGSVDRYSYSNTELFDGTPIDQQYRNNRIGTVGGSVQYSLKNGIGLIASGSYVDEQYDDRPGHGKFNPATDINRDSHGFNLLGGVTLELSRLIFGTLQVGYLQRSYEDPRLNNFGGLSFSGDILWNVTALTSVRFRASRSVQDTSSPQIAGNTRSDFSVTVDHELFRYIIVSGDASYGHFRPNGVGIGGDEYGVGVRGRYLIDRRFSIIGGVRSDARSSDSPFLVYHAVSGRLGLRVGI